MKTIKCAIVDDEKLGIDSLKWELSRVSKDIQVDATFTSPIEAIPYLNQAEIDLLFLDIQMPNMNGFELLKALDQVNFSVVFVTAFDTYALKAFKFSALEYLLKPVDSVELRNVLKKYTDQTRIVAQTDLRDHVDIQETVQKGGLPNRVVFTTKEAYEFIKPEDILYCEADSNYTTIYQKSSKLIVSKTLKDVELLLQDFGFIRVHQSYLINPKHITRYLKNLGGSVVMDNGKEISVSRSKKDLVLDLLLNR